MIGTKRATAEADTVQPADGSFELLGDLDICLIYEFLAIPKRYNVLRMKDFCRPTIHGRSDVDRMKDVVALSGTCRRLRAIAMCQAARLGVWPHLMLTGDMVDRRTPPGVPRTIPTHFLGGVAFGCARYIDDRWIPPSQSAELVRTNSRSLVKVSLSTARPTTLAEVFALPQLREVAILPGNSPEPMPALASPTLTSILVATPSRALVDALAAGSGLPRVSKVVVVADGAGNIAGVLRACPAVQSIGLFCAGRVRCAGLGSVIAGLAELRAVSMRGRGTLAPGQTYWWHAMRELELASGLTVLNAMGAGVYPRALRWLGQLVKLTVLRLTIVEVTDASVAVSAQEAATELVALGNVAGAVPLLRVSLELDTTADIGPVFATPRFRAVTRLSLHLHRIVPPVAVPPSAAATLRRLSCRIAGFDSVRPIMDTCAAVVHLRLGATDSWGSRPGMFPPVPAGMPGVRPTSARIDTGNGMSMFAATQLACRIAGNLRVLRVNTVGGEDCSEAWAQFLATDPTLRVGAIRGGRIFTAIRT